ncbi:hypothetical protein [Piscirickettsia litoralis]|uniref:Acid-shock protein n=1 Tax=Piscirickettsia litoralis TaxID=1891921 RepID=A0ABX3A669_9GAMM|nr:hypothetical protein [Piscirickettsia litoralis]ODN42940.1 hypothetical protein BGC07_08410 [Piscirickettsia litoralis]
MLLRKITVMLPIVLLAGSTWAHSPITTTKKSQAKHYAHKISTSTKHALDKTKAKIKTKHTHYKKKKAIAA